jgi:hypothetical protein
MVEKKDIEKIEAVFTQYSNSMKKILLENEDVDSSLRDVISWSEFKSFRYKC